MKLLDLKELGKINDCEECPFFGRCDDECTHYSSKTMAIQDMEEILDKIQKVLDNLRG